MPMFEKPSANADVKTSTPETQPVEANECATEQVGKT